MPRDKVAVVTGAGRGIGASIAKALASEGAKVVIVDIDPAQAEQLVAEIREAGGEAFSQAADVCNSEQVKHVFETVVGRYGGVDILVNNAGITRDALLLRMKDEDWDAVLNINLKGAFLCTRKLPKLCPRGDMGGSSISPRWSARWAIWARPTTVPARRVSSA